MSAHRRILVPVGQRIYFRRLEDSHPLPFTPPLRLLPNIILCGVCKLVRVGLRMEKHPGRYRDTVRFVVQESYREHILAGIRMACGLFKG